MSIKILTSPVNALLRFLQDKNLFPNGPMKQHQGYEKLCTDFLTACTMMKDVAVLWKDAEVEGDEKTGNVLIDSLMQMCKYGNGCGTAVNAEYPDDTKVVLDKLDTFVQDGVFFPKKAIVDFITGIDWRELTSPRYWRAGSILISSAHERMESNAAGYYILLGMASDLERIQKRISPPYHELQDHMQMMFVREEKDECKDNNINSNGKREKPM